jgi:hypothetical protein
MKSTVLLNLCLHFILLHSTVVELKAFLKQDRSVLLWEIACPAIRPFTAFIHFETAHSQLGAYVQHL